MSGGLILRLRPNEKFIVNGAVLENGEKRAKLRVKSQGVNVLRLRDALHPDDATTPVKRLYYVAQLVVTGDLAVDAASPELAQGLNALYDALPGEECRENIKRACEHVERGEFYQVMRALKPILPLEEGLLLLAKMQNVSVAENRAG